MDKNKLDTKFLNNQMKKIEMAIIFEIGLDTISLMMFLSMFHV